MLSPKHAKHRQYSQAFEESWTAYPRRDGPTSKVDAHHQWQRRLLEGYEVQQIHKGVLAYKAHCDRTGITGTRTVMQAERFFGKALHFLTDYEAPNTVAAARRVWNPPTERAEDIPHGYLTGLLEKAIRRR